jgi:hypothetical protein
MPNRPAKSVFFRRFLFVLLLLASIILITAASFRLQSYFFALKVQSVLSRMGQIKLDRTSQAEVLALMPELRPDTQPSFIGSGQPDIGCPGDACFALHTQNWPEGILAKLQVKLDYRSNWLFKAVYWLGHRFLLFAAYVEIRGGTVSRYEYSLGVENRDFPASEIVEVEVLGADREGFPGYFGFMRDYDEIGGFRIRVPSNRPTTSMCVGFTPDAKPEDVRNAFDVHLNCVWNAQGCSATKQLLPLLWEQKMEPRSQK